LGALTEAVIGAKLLPPAARPEHLARPRLTERLASGLDARATVVVAGAGYGKSTLVARFLSESGIDGIWYTLDPSDRDPWAFFRYLVHGVRARVPEFGLRTSGLWESLRYRDDQVERFVDVFLRDAEESLAGHLVLVLDRIECLEGGETGIAALFTSEPVRTPHHVGGCLVVGRLAVKTSTSAVDAARIAAGDPWPWRREWASWNVRRLAKAVFGKRYERLRGVVLSHRIDLQGD